MSPHFWWYLARGSGLVAFGILTASVAFGLALSTRLFGRSVAPAWLLELHRYLGTLAIGATATHVGALLLDSYVSFRWVDVIVPFASRWHTAAVAWGVIALWLLVAVEGTSLLMRRLPRRLWRTVHLTSFLLFAAALGHGLTAGTDGRVQLVQTAAVATVMVVLFLGLVRVLAPRSATRRAAATATPAP